MKFKLLVLFSLVTSILFAQEYRLVKIETNNIASFRGLSIVDDHVVWISGSQGRVGVSEDGGVSWSFNQVKGFENTDFRALYAFDAQHALIANAGSPAYILITNDGGKNWNSVYTNSHKDAFIDGVDFWNDKEGIIYGDPIDGKMLLLRTLDGGMNWTEIKAAPVLEKGEASFAASGTGIRCINKNQVIISTGGKISRLWISKDKGMNWSAMNTPILQGESTIGIFSFAQNNKALIIVGGDYKNESMNKRHNFYSVNGGQQWLTPGSPTRGYRECVEPVSKTIAVATGPSGTDISYDGGINWKALSDEKGLHVVRRARKGSLVILAGGQGQVFLMK